MIKSALLVSLALLLGCGGAQAAPAQSPETSTTIQEQVVVVAQPPPQELAEVITLRPSPAHVWVAGHWYWTGARYVWTRGVWVHRPGYLWVAPRWRYHYGYHRWYYRAGYWRHR